MKLASVLVLSGLLLPAIAVADPAADPAMQPQVHPVWQPPPYAKPPDCFCTDRSGARIELGQQLCLQVDGRMFTAQCQMSLNVPMWRKLHDGCATSHHPQQGFGHI